MKKTRNNQGKRLDIHGDASQSLENQIANFINAPTEDYLANLQTLLVYCENSQNPKHFEFYDLAEKFSGKGGEKKPIFTPALSQKKYLTFLLIFNSFSRVVKSNSHENLYSSISTVLKTFLDKNIADSYSDQEKENFIQFIEQLYSHVDFMKSPLGGKVLLIHLIEKLIENQHQHFIRYLLKRIADKLNSPSINHLRYFTYVFLNESNEFTDRIDKEIDKSRKDWLTQFARKNWLTQLAIDILRYTEYYTVKIWFLYTKEFNAQLYLDKIIKNQRCSIDVSEKKKEVISKLINVIIYKSNKYNLALRKYLLGLILESSDLKEFSITDLRELVFYSIDHQYLNFLNLILKKRSDLLDADNPFIYDISHKRISHNKIVYCPKLIALASYLANQEIVDIFLQNMPTSFYEKSISIGSILPLGISEKKLEIKAINGYVAPTFYDKLSVEEHNKEIEPSISITIQEKSYYESTVFIHSLIKKSRFKTLEKNSYHLHCKGVGGLRHEFHDYIDGHFKIKISDKELLLILVKYWLTKINETKEKPKVLFEDILTPSLDPISSNKVALYDEMLQKSSGLIRELNNSKYHLENLPSLITYNNYLASLLCSLNYSYISIPMKKYLFKIIKAHHNKFFSAVPAADDNYSSSRQKLKKSLSESAGGIETIATFVDEKLMISHPVVNELFLFLATEYAKEENYIKAIHYTSLLLKYHTENKAQDITRNEKKLIKNLPYYMAKAININLEEKEIIILEETYTLLTEFWQLTNNENKKYLNIKRFCNLVRNKNDLNIEDILDCLNFEFLSNAILLSPDKISSNTQYFLLCTDTAPSSKKDIEGETTEILLLDFLAGLFHDEKLQKSLHDFLLLPFDSQIMDTFISLIKSSSKFLILPLFMQFLQAPVFIQALILKTYLATFYLLEYGRLFSQILSNPDFAPYYDVLKLEGLLTLLIAKKNNPKGINKLLRNPYFNDFFNEIKESAALTEMSELIYGSIDRDLIQLAIAITAALEKTNLSNAMLEQLANILEKLNINYPIITKLKSQVNEKLNNLISLNEEEVKQLEERKVISEFYKGGLTKALRIVLQEIEKDGMQQVDLSNKLLEINKNIEESLSRINMAPSWKLHAPTAQAIIDSSCMFLTIMEQLCNALDLNNYSLNLARIDIFEPIGKLQKMLSNFYSIISDLGIQENDYLFRSRINEISLTFARFMQHQPQRAPANQAPGSVMYVHIGGANYSPNNLDLDLDPNFKL